MGLAVVPYLSKEEEKELINFITTCSKMGYGKTRKEVLALVEAAIEKKGRELKNPILMAGGPDFKNFGPTFGCVEVILFLLPVIR